MKVLSLFFWIIAVAVVTLEGAEALATTKVKLALNWKPEAEFGGFYSAEQNGAYKAEKLNVEILQGGVGTPVVQMVGAGKAEFGISSADEIVIARARGMDLVALWVVYQTSPSALMTQESRNAKGLEDLLKSGTLAVQKGMPWFSFFEKKYGPIKAKVVPQLGGVSQVASDPNLAQQCYITSEPLTARKQGIKTKTFLISESGYNPYSTVVFTRTDYLKKNGAVVDAFVRSIAKGWQTYLKDPSESNALMSKLNPTMDLETLKESAEAQKALIETEDTKKIGLGGMSKERWALVAQQLKDLKLVEKTDSPESYFYWKKP